MDKTVRKIKEKEIKDYKNVKTQYYTFKSIEIREKPNLEIKTKHNHFTLRLVILLEKYDHSWRKMVI